MDHAHKIFQLLIHLVKVALTWIHSKLLSKGEHGKDENKSDTFGGTRK